MYENLLPEFFDFLKRNPSPFHVVGDFRNTLTAAGFTELQENKPYALKAGGSYFVVRNESALMAFKVPEGDFSGFSIVASHCDSPSFKIKANPEMESAGCYVRLNVEKYGGMMYSPWFDLPLSIAGRVLVQAEGRLETRLFKADRDLVLIPHVAIHMDHSINEGQKFNPQVDLIPLIGSLESKGELEKLIAETVGVEPEAIAAEDLFLYNRMEPTVWGIKNEYMAAPRLDDLQCTYASFRAFLDAENASAIPVFALFDNEEVGSGTKQGACGTFLKDTLKRVCLGLGKTEAEYMAAVADSFMVSADNAHAVHPNHTEKADPVNQPKMNEGIVIKYHANQKYTTDAVSAAVFKAICAKAEVPWQEFTNRSDSPGGSTLGNLSNAQVSLNAVDIGLPQLAMHSTYETAGVKDSVYLAKALRVFYASAITMEKPGCFSIR